MPVFRKTFDIHVYSLIPDLPADARLRVAILCGLQTRFFVH